MKTYSKVEAAEDEVPTKGRPCPMCDWVIDDGSPAEDEDEDGCESPALGRSTEADDTGDRRELEPDRE
jgi:hypothetical protein